MILFNVFTSPIKGFPLVLTLFWTVKIPFETTPVICFCQYVVLSLFALITITNTFSNL